MCGIAGIFDLQGERQPDPRALKRMSDAIAHRGPDGEGFFEAPGLAFSHRRLAVIDIAGGAQPFIASDGQSALVYNGEIYNYRDLRREALASGAEFRTRSDTEALAEGMLRHGADFIPNLRGMFAFAFWNARQKTLTLARDRFGEKPLYYARTDDGFLLFASELSALRAHGGLTLTHRADALHDYFLYGYVPDPKCVYEGVFKLPAASTMVAVRGAALKMERYWRAGFSPDPSLTLETAREKLLDLLDDAVAAQLEADVPLGAFLSGGVDSSAIVASMSKSTAHITTATIGFDNAAFDERREARIIAERYKTSHHERVLDIDATALIDRIAHIYAEPFADPSALATYEIARVARERVTVALSGDGADEIFGGYRRYRMFAAEERLRRLAPASVRRALFARAGAAYPKLDWAPRALRFKTTLQALGEEPLAAYGRAVAASLPDRLDVMVSEEFRRSLGDYNGLSPLAAVGADAGLDPLSFAQLIDIESWLPGRMLTKIDRASMAHGLEVRAPFLDHRLAEWAFSLPPALRLSGGIAKRVLKAAQEPRLNHDLIYRPKKGFSPPVAQWLRAPNGPLDRLQESSLWANSGYLSRPAVTRMIERHKSGVSDYAQELWAVIMFDAFMRNEQAAATSRPREAAPASRAASAQSS